MDEFSTIAVPAPLEDAETSQVPFNYDTSNGWANYFAPSFDIFRSLGI